MEQKLHSTEGSAQRTVGGCFIDSPVSSKLRERRLEWASSRALNINIKSEMV